VAWFVSNLLVGDLPTELSEVDNYLERVKANADAVLEGSERLSHLDLESESDAKEAIEIVKKDHDSPEWWALVMGTFASVLLDELRSGTSAEVMLHSLRMQSAHTMLVFKQSLEEHVWTGYKHTKLIYDIAAANAQTPEDADKIQALRPLFSRLDEDLLHAWVEADVEIGPKIGVTNVEEPLLRGLAKYHLSVFERRRQERRLEQERSYRIWANRIAAGGVGAAVATALVAAYNAIF
jgi:hypothetical protein